MKVLIIHHVQPRWDYSLRKFGTSFDEMLEKVNDHLCSTNYNEVIVTNFKSYEIEPEQDFVRWSMVDNYDYGWDMEVVHEGEESAIKQVNADFANGHIYTDVHGRRWAEGGLHSEAVIIPDWFDRIVNSEVYLCGAFDGECIEDMEIALRSFGIKFHRLNELIV